MKKIIYYLLALSLLLSGIFANYDVVQMKGKPALNKKTATLTVGKTVKLKLKNYKKTVKWTSSNKNVASVSRKGLVKAKKAGKAKITAKAGGKRYVCQVTVRAKASQSSSVNSYPKKVLQLVNAERKKEGLDPLELDPDLCKVAGIRAKEITKKFDHTRPNGKTCFSILKEYDISYSASGENIAAGQPSPASVVKSWMGSEGHRANILSKKFHKLGVGYVKASDGYKHYWVQVFSD